VFFAVRRNPLPNDVAGIADRFRRRQNLEIRQGKIAEGVEIIHLAADIQEGVLGAVTERRAADDHSGVIASLAVDAIGRARRATQSPEVSEGITQLRFSAGESQKQEEQCEAKGVFCFHGWESEPPTMPGL
jgi:hypothetical protein